MAATRKTHQEIKAIGDALANAAFQRGERLTDEQKQALAHWSMWGSDGYPIHKMGDQWALRHATVSFRLFPTKWQATEAWETMIDKWIRMKGLEQHAHEMAHA